MPRTRRHLIVVCLLLLLIPVTTLRAQQGGVGAIIGELHVNRGDFPGRIFIELQLRGATLASAYSDDQGKFGFTGLGSNPYHIVIHDEHFYPVDQLVVLDTSISTVGMAQVNLNQRELRKEPELDREPGSNPYLIDPAEYRQHFPRNAVKEFDKGIDADKRQKLDEAIRHYEKAISLAPDFYPAHNNLGSAYLAQSNFTGAQTQFEAALRLNQSDAEAHLNLANVLLLTKKYDDALINVEEGLRRAPTSPFGMFLLGSIYERLGKFPESERALRQALDLDPHLGNAHLELVNLYLAEKNRPQAVAEIKTFLKNFPADPMVPKAKQVLQRLDK